ncbi:MAG: hypothetical protein EHM71_00330 [Zetaproteobacteria bacterium]|nr:MAG: hypothetical protein EHM71_00330 [Zetaproteobacteria bacterium]
MPTSSDTEGAARRDGAEIRFEATVGSDGRIETLTERRSDGGGRPVDLSSREAIAVLTRGDRVEYRFDDGRRLRNLPYLDLLHALRQEVLLTAHKVRHGELLDEPDALPALKGLLARIEATAKAFRLTSAGAC